jgi:hypothetical protein
MKLCFMDEGGNQYSDSSLVIVGIIVDDARIGRSRPRACAKWSKAVATENLKALGGKN